MPILDSSIRTSKSYYKAATGYVTTADYVGQIFRDGVESVTYQVKYLGTKGGKIEVPAEHIGNTLPEYVPYVFGGLGLLLAIVLTVLLVRSRREARAYQEEEPAEHEHEEDVHL